MLLLTPRLRPSYQVDAHAIVGYTCCQQNTHQTACLCGSSGEVCYCTWCSNGWCCDQGNKEARPRNTALLGGVQPITGLSCSSLFRTTLVHFLGTPMHCRLACGSIGTPRQVRECEFARLCHGCLAARMLLPVLGKQPPEARTAPAAQAWSCRDTAHAGLSLDFTRDRWAMLCHTRLAHGQ